MNPVKSISTNTFFIRQVSPSDFTVINQNEKSTQLWISFTLSQDYISQHSIIAGYNSQAGIEKKGSFEPAKIIASRLISQMESLLDVQQNRSKLAVAVVKTEKTLRNSLTFKKNLTELINNNDFQKTRGIFDQLESRIKQLPLERLLHYCSDDLEMILSNNIFPMHSISFLTSFNDIFDIDVNEKKLVNVFRKKMDYYLKPYLTLYNMYLQIKQDISIEDLSLEELNPKTLSSLYPIVGRFFKENPDSLEQILESLGFESNEIKDSILTSSKKLISLREDTYMQYITRLIAFNGEKPQEVLEKFDKELKDVFVELYYPNKIDLQRVFVSDLYGIAQKKITVSSESLEKLLDIISTSIENKMTRSKPKESFKVLPKEEKISYNQQMIPTYDLDLEAFMLLDTLFPDSNLVIKMDKDYTKQEQIEFLNKDKPYASNVTVLNFPPLSGWYKDPKNIVSLLMQFPNLKELSFEEFIFENNEILTIIPTLKQLKDLSMKGCQFSHNDSLSVIGKMKNIKSIDLSQTNITTEHLSVLVSDITHSVHIFARSCSNIKKTDFKELQEKFSKITLFA